MPAALQLQTSLTAQLPATCLLAGWHRCSQLQLVLLDRRSKLQLKASTQHETPVVCRTCPQVYLLYHPELRQQGVDSLAAAAQHYLTKGRAEGRPYKRLRVLLRYIACTGLINQHYSHIAAFTLAATLGAELVLPPAVCRDSFAHYFRCALSWVS